MPKPDWDAIQKPNERSKEHGKRDHEHGPQEHGTGGKATDEEKARGRKLREEAEAEELASGEQLASAYPSYYYVPNKPPVRDQGSTPQCVAYSNGYDQAQHDRPEAGRFLDFWEAKFFDQIGGGPGGAYMTAGLKRRRDFGYPTVGGGTAKQGAHRISSYTDVPQTVDYMKAALSRGHGVLAIGPWYHSWFHPFASGKLPSPDYEIGGHAIWLRGWNDNYGFRIRNSWGTDWGLSGDAFLPYVWLPKMWSIYRTADR